MKMMLTVLGIGLGVAVVGLAEPEKPATEVEPPGVVEKDLGLYVFPDRENPLLKPGQDAMLARLMGEMLKEAELDRKEMAAPVEMPKLDAPELRHLFGGTSAGGATILKRWMIGVRLLPGGKERIVVSNVIAGSPAAEAGLGVADVLLDVNGIWLRDHEMLVELLQVVRDQEVVLGVRRGAKTLKVKITPRESKVPGRDGPRIEMQKIEVAPRKVDRDDEVLKELRGMRGLMEEMLKELKKPKVAEPASRPRTRRVPTPPQNR